MPTNLRWLLWALLALTGIGAALALLLTETGRTHATALAPAANGPAAVWAAGKAPAPGFTLTDQAGRQVSLAAYRGRAVIVTFLDPDCRDFCPLEAKVLNDAFARLAPEQRPAVVAVSTNVYANAPRYLLRDTREWHLGPEWRWAVGTQAQLERVWSGYHVSVFARTTHRAGRTQHEIVHTEAAYLVDRNGDERALFIWPFRSAAVRQAIGSLP